MVTIANSPCEGGWARSTSVVQVNLATLEARSLLEDDSRLLITAEWPEPSTVVLQDQNGQRVKMNAATGQIEQNAATGILQGHVNIGPLQPVIRVDEPTPVVPPEAYAARQIVIYATDGQTEVARVQIGPDGNYKVALPPGAYVVDINRAGMELGQGPACQGSDCSRSDTNARHRNRYGHPVGAHFKIQDSSICFSAGSPAAAQ